MEHLSMWGAMVLTGRQPLNTAFCNAFIFGRSVFVCVCIHLCLHHHHKNVCFNTFWHDFSDIVTKLTGFTFPLDSQISWLGNFTAISAHLRNSHNRFLAKALCIAGKCIAASWKSDSHLPIARWFLEMNSCIPLEKITYNLRNEYNTFLKIWQPYLTYIDTLPTRLSDII